MNASPLRILHVITGLEGGGAETSLYRLLAQIGAGFSSQVVSLTTDRPMGDRIRELGIPVTALGLRPGLPDPRLLSGVRKALRRFHPHLVQTWMYHADLVGGLAAKMEHVPVVWNIRHTAGRMSDFKPATRLVVALNARLSHTLPVGVICNSTAGLQSHVNLGYAAEKMVIIPNGFELDIFHPDPAARKAVRREMGIPADTPLIGMCARYHPHKDHETFVHAAALLRQRNPVVQFLLWGQNIDWNNGTLAGWLDQYAVREAFHLLGYRTDSPSLAAALDVATLSSITEGFPNALGEAMACQVPCVATDVGDSAYILGETGRAVPPRNPRALAEAWGALLALPRPERETLGQAARKRITGQFDIRKTTAAYEQLYRDIIGSTSGGNLK
jgi:glycosyltransferase involved in cell wall biosynthesis